ncbi:MAG TPA: GAF domain-containing protein [Actinomycetota bacterium]|jgi:GAF domain-containing protein
MSTVPKDEAERLAALQRYGVLDTPPEDSFDRLTRLATRIFDVPIALVSLVDQDRQWFKSCTGLDVAETPRWTAFCSQAILSDDVTVVPDATLDPRFADSPLVTEMGIRFYAGAPLRSPDGHNLGTLCIKDRVPRDLSAEQRDMLRDLAAVVVDEMELRLALNRLAGSNQELYRDRARAVRALHDLEDRTDSPPPA